MHDGAAAEEGDEQYLGQSPGVRQQAKQIDEQPSYKGRQPEREGLKGKREVPHWTGSISRVLHHGPVPRKALPSQ